MSNKKRYAIVMLISVLFNIIFYSIAHYCHLPIWLDLQGTAFAALMLEPAAGLLVGLTNNFIEAIFFYDVSSIIYFAVSASVALIIGLYLKDQGKIKPKRIIPTILMVVVATSLISAALSMWRTNGIPDSKWELHFFQIAKDVGMPTFICSFFGTMVLKIGDAIVSTILIGILYVILPRSLKKAPEMKIDEVNENIAINLNVQFSESILDDNEEIMIEKEEIE